MDFHQFPAGFNLVVVLACIALVAKGADIVVEAASRLALTLGVSELVIGLTVVSLGTSAPEFAVTLNAAWKGMGDISVGNIVGSNIFNLGIIMGGCALVRPLQTSRTLFRRDGMVLLGSTLLLYGMVATPWISRELSMDRVDGAILLGLLFLYLVKLYWDEDPGAAEELEGISGEDSPTRKSVGELLFGLSMIVLGSHIMVDAASAIARAYGLSEWVIGATIVAAGTSAPEFATSLVAALRGRHDIGAGNLIGSDIFNLLGVLGLAGVLRPVEVQEAARVSLGMLVAMVFLALCCIRTGWEISRKEGFLLVSFGLLRWSYDLGFLQKILASLPQP